MAASQLHKEAGHSILSKFSARLNLIRSLNYCSNIPQNDYLISIHCPTEMFNRIENCWSSLPVSIRGRSHTQLSVMRLLVHWCGIAAALVGVGTTFVSLPHFNHSTAAAASASELAPEMCILSSSPNALWIALDAPDCAMQFNLNLAKVLFSISKTMEHAIRAFCVACNQHPIETI